MVPEAFAQGLGFEQMGWIRLFTDRLAHAPVFIGSDDERFSTKFDLGEHITPYAALQLIQHARGTIMLDAVGGPNFRSNVRIAGIGTETGKPRVHAAMYDGWKDFNLERMGVSVEPDEEFIIARSVFRQIPSLVSYPGILPGYVSERMVQEVGGTQSNMVVFSPHHTRAPFDEVTIMKFSRRYYPLDKRTTFYNIIRGIHTTGLSYTSPTSSWQVNFPSQLEKF